MNTQILDDTQPLDDHARKVIISLNPKAGSGPSAQLAEQLKQILDDRGFDVEIETDLSTIISKHPGIRQVDP